ncbi:MAG: hypothetical protein ACOYOF_15340 [Verrucomicrobiaceae bacterium]
MSKAPPQRLSLAQFRALQANGDSATSAQKKPKGAARPQIRLPKVKRITEVEQAWMDRCQVVYATYGNRLRILHEPLTLRLADGTRYTPDVVVCDLDRILTIYEVKDQHIHDRKGSLRAFKAARAQFSHWRFCFIQRRGGEWTKAGEEGAETAP